MKKLLRKWRRWRAGKRLAKVINGSHKTYGVGYDDGHKAGWEAGYAAGWNNVRHYASDRGLH